MCSISFSLPPHLVRPASRPCSGKNFGAVCSGVVHVPLDELLLLYGDTRLSCARMSKTRWPSRRWCPGGHCFGGLPSRDVLCPCGL
jgi:hypothetical protein